MKEVFLSPPLPSLVRGGMEKREKDFWEGKESSLPKKLEGIQAWPLVRNLHNIRIEASTETIVKCLCLFVFPRLQSPDHAHRVHLSICPEVGLSCLVRSRVRLSSARCFLGLCPAFESRCSPYSVNCRADNRIMHPKGSQNDLG